MKPNIGLIGIGYMSSHMAQRLMNAGYPLTVSNRIKQKAQQVGQRNSLCILAVVSQEEDFSWVDYV